MSSGQFPLRNSVAVVTGAAGGIGAALAAGLAKRGCHLALTDRTPDALAITAASARALGVNVSEHVFDLADPAAIAALPEQVNNAGVALAGSFEDVSIDEIEWLFQINFWAVVRMMKAFLPLLKQQKEAQIVNIASVFGLVGSPNEAPYCASKFAVRGMSEALRHEFDLAGYHVGITLVYPAGVKTGIALNTRPAAGMSAEAAKRFDEFLTKGHWEKILNTPPETVAEQILAGVERRKKRILCGQDSLKLDLIQRLLPVNYWVLFQRGMRRKAK